MKRAVEAEEIAAAAVFLASDNAQIDQRSHDRDRRRLVDARLSGAADRSENPERMMIDARRYTSGRIAVANLSASIDSLELRRVEGATFEDLVALSKLLFVRGDLLGRIADHDRAESVANEAVASSPSTRGRALHPRAARGAFPSVRGSKRAARSSARGRVSEARDRCRKGGAAPGDGPISRGAGSAREAGEGRSRDPHARRARVAAGGNGSMGGGRNLLRGRARCR